MRHSFIHKGILCIALALATLTCWAQAKHKFTIVSHYSYPPYQTGNNQGLSFELAQYLTEQSQHRYQFDVANVPKPRLIDSASKPNWTGIIPWITPQWFPTLPKDHLQWSSTVLESVDLVLSRNNQALEWNGPQSLFGQRFGGINGHIYAELEDAFKTRKIIREDGPDLKSNFAKLRAGRIDVLFADSRSIAYFQLTDPHLIDNFYISKNPRSNAKHQLKMLFNLGDTEANAWLADTLSRMPSDKKWRAILKSYGND